MRFFPFLFTVASEVGRVTSACAVGWEGCGWVIQYKCRCFEGNGKFDGLWEPRIDRLWMNGPLFFYLSM